MADLNSAFYPYEKVMTGFNTLKGAEKIPLKILSYLLDLPDKNGYEPTDDNERARVRLCKYLWYDGANPLSNPLPSPQEKLSMLFDGNEPDINTDEQKAKHPKGYRLFPQVYWMPAQLTAKTVIKAYIGRIIPNSNFKTSIGLTFEILVNYGQENTVKTEAYSRSYDIEQCIIEALHGVNFTGIGVADFSRMAHMDNGSRPIHDDGTHVGRVLTMSLDWMESTQPEITI